MMLLSMKMYLALLWGISVLISMTKSVSIPETSSSSNSTAEPNKETRQLNTSHALYETETQHETWDPTHKSAEISAVATTEINVSPTVESQEANVSSKSDNSNVGTTGLVVMNTVAATASSSDPRLRHIPTTAAEAQPSHNTIMSETAKPTEDQQSRTTSTEMTATTFAGAVISASSASSSAREALSSPQPTSITEPEVTSDLFSSTSSTTFAGAVMSASSAASSAREALSSPQPTSITEREVTSDLFSTTSSENLTQAPHSIQNLSSPSTSTMTTMTTNPTSKAAPVFDPTSLPVTITETVTTSTEFSSTFQPISDTRTHISTSQFPDTTGSSSTTESPATSVSNDSAISTTAFSSSPAGVLIPHVPKRLPVPTAKSTTTTKAVPHEGSKSPSITEVQPCSTRGVVKNCLIAIASLGGLATIFMVTTIILCTKLSARKYKAKKPQKGTEMICISSLLPERDYSYTRQRNPVSNGVLVFPTGGDSDEEGGDNLTLSSFLPDNDRNV